MIIKDFSNLSEFEKIFYADFWPEYFFVNGYPLLGVVWNLFLLAIPFFLFFLFRRYWEKYYSRRLGQKIILFLIFIFWLLFLPNTAYLITDVRHLSDYCLEPNYYRVCPNNVWMLIFFFGYALAGWAAFVLALNQARYFIEKEYNRRAGLIFVSVIIPLVALGVIIGLVNRWNSWEIFTDPMIILKSIALYFYEWIYLKNLLAYIVGFYAFYFVGDWLFKKRN